MKVVSLFAGCGGLDLGLVQAGHQIVHASDIDKKANDSHILLSGDVFIYSKQIYNVSIKRKCVFILLFY